MPICFVLTDVSQHINGSIYSGDMLAQLAEKHADLKEMLNIIKSLRNSNVQMLFDDNAFVKMAKNRQKNSIYYG